MIYSVKNTNDDLNYMKVIHKNITGKRKKDFQKNVFVNHETKQFGILLTNIERILDSYNIQNYDINKIQLEFHQRNCSGEKDFEHFVWHKDDYNAVPYKCWSIIYYLRKDIGISKGNFIYKINNKIYKHNVNGGDILLFSGDIKHKPEISNGFGCRDAIVVFVKRT